MRGTELKQTINDALSQARQQADSAHRQLRGASAELDGLVHRQAQAAMSLARVVIEHVGSHSKGGELAEQLRQAMERRDEEQERLQRMAEWVRQQRAQAIEELEARRAELIRADEQRVALEQACVTDLVGNERWGRCQAQMEQLAEQIERTRAKLETAREDAAMKAPAYENDPLFSYLLSRNYGQEQYQGGVLTSRLDAWVARLVQFPRFFSDYRRLQAIPDKIAEHIDYLAGLKQQLEQQFDEAKTQALAQWPGYPQALEAFATAELAVAAAEHHLLELESSLQHTDEELFEFTQGQDPYSVGAMEAVKNLVLEGKRDRAQLLVEASDTTEDDRLLRDIQALDQRIQSAKKEVDKAKRHHAEMVRRQREAQEFSSRFDREQLGRADKRYSSINSHSVAEAILLGHALGDVFSTIQRDVRTIAPPLPRPAVTGTGAVSAGADLGEEALEAGVVLEAAGSPLAAGSSVSAPVEQALPVGAGPRAFAGPGQARYPDCKPSGTRHDQPHLPQLRTHLHLPAQPCFADGGHGRAANGVP